MVLRFKKKCNLIPRNWLLHSQLCNFQKFLHEIDENEGFLNSIEHTNLFSFNNNVFKAQKNKFDKFSDLGGLFLGLKTLLHVHKLYVLISMM